MKAEVGCWFCEPRLGERWWINAPSSQAISLLTLDLRYPLSGERAHRFLMFKSSNGWSSIVTALGNQTSGFPVSCSPACRHILSWAKRSRHSLNSTFTDGAHWLVHSGWGNDIYSFPEKVNAAGSPSYYPATWTNAIDAKETKKGSGPFWVSLDLSEKSYCGGLDEMLHISLWHLKTWSPVGGTVWEGLGVMVLLARVCHWGWAYSFKSPCHSQCALFTSCLRLRCELPAVPITHCGH